MRRTLKIFTCVLLSITFLYIIVYNLATPVRKNSRTFSQEQVAKNGSTPIKNCPVTNEEEKLNISSNCSTFVDTIRQYGFSISACNGRLGNQLGLLVLGFALHSQFGVKLILGEFQHGILDKVFDMQQICKSDGSSFCIFNQLGNVFSQSESPRHFLKKWEPEEAQ